MKIGNCIPSSCVLFHHAENTVENILQKFSTISYRTTTCVESCRESLSTMDQQSLLHSRVAHIFNLDVQRMLRLLGADEADKDLYNGHENDNDASENLEEDVGSNKKLIVLEKLRSLLKKIRQSEQLQNKLKNCCESLNIRIIATIINVYTRWNSTYSMMKAASHLNFRLILLCENNSEEIGRFILTGL